MCTMFGALDLNHFFEEFLSLLLEKILMAMGLQATLLFLYKTKNVTLSKTSTMLAWPSEAAICNGVLSTLVLASRLTPARSNTSVVE